MRAVKTAKFIQKYSPREGHSAIFLFQGKNLKHTGFMQRQCWQPQKTENSKVGAYLQKQNIQ
jgi:hypothetical protein